MMNLRCFASVLRDLFLCRPNKTLKGLLFRFMHSVVSYWHSIVLHLLFLQYLEDSCFALPPSILCRRESDEKRSVSVESLCLGCRSSVYCEI
ncbi:hypothetical protein CPC08DRAFT_558195 [Agrocybe pediades]|nr:hypothetical protein CPC08DRAFT_558195 [Agrocybe pediades]